MATFALRRFSNPPTLRSIAPDRLLEFLDPFKDFFSERGYPLPEAASGADINYQALVDIFMSPSANTPKKLLDALFLVDEMSTPEDAAVLLEACEGKAVFASGPDQSSADIAVQVWLFDKDILERKHAERFLFKAKSFEYFQSKAMTPPVFETPTPATVGKLEGELDDWFDKKKRGRGTRVFIYPKDDEVWCLVRHGEPFKREEGLRSGAVESVCYRPLKYDVAVYDRQLGELRINARLVGEKKLYCQQFGKHLFRDEDCFPGRNKYTLEPLREYGADSLACGDIEGIESIVLVEIEFFWGGAYRARNVMKADDIFADLAEKQRQLPEGGRTIKAVFKVTFVDSKTPRSVTIKPSNVAQYTRDSDAALVEQWLKLREFIVERELQADEINVQALAGS